MKVRSPKVNRVCSELLGEPMECVECVDGGAVGDIAGANQGQVAVGEPQFGRADGDGAEHRLGESGVAVEQQQIESVRPAVSSPTIKPCPSEEGQGF